MEKLNARLLPQEKNAMQAGHLGKKGWHLVFSSIDGEGVDSVMGWVSQKHPGQKVMTFSTKEEALAYCKKHHINPVVLTESFEHDSSPEPKSYADNFTKGLRW